MVNVLRKYEYFRNVLEYGVHLSSSKCILKYSEYEYRSTSAPNPDLNKL